MEFNVIPESLILLKGDSQHFKTRNEPTSLHFDACRLDFSTTKLYFPNFELCLHNTYALIQKKLIPKS
jgi:hypothetical protein